MFILGGAWFVTYLPKDTILVFLSTQYVIVILEYNHTYIHCMYVYIHINIFLLQKEKYAILIS